MSEAILRNHEERIKRLEELHRPKRPKPKRELWPLDPKPVLASMAEKGWSQSDLAALMFGGYKINNQGKRTAIGKDRISVWLSGKNCPSPEHRALLAQFVDLV